MKRSLPGKLFFLKGWATPGCVFEPQAFLGGHLCSLYLAVL